MSSIPTLHREPSVHLVGTPTFDLEAAQQYLDARHPERVLPFGVSPDAVHDGDAIPELAGRMCYKSFAKPRPGGNKAYLDHIKECGHGSTLEHSVWVFLFSGISRSLSHELVRHRAGVGISQESQRYVDESAVAYVVPPALRDEVDLAVLWQNCNEQMEVFLGTVLKDARFSSLPSSALFEMTDAGAVWLSHMIKSSKVYIKLNTYLAEKAPADLSGTDRRKWARQAARSVLPNAAETRILWSANARALRHCIEMRASRHADTEIRALFVKVLRIMQQEAPNLFGDYRIEVLPDGTEAAETEWRKV